MSTIAYLTIIDAIDISKNAGEDRRNRALSNRQAGEDASSSNGGKRGDASR